MVLDKYAHLKEELVTCIDSMLTLEMNTDGLYEEFRDKIQNNVFNLVVLGQFKRGKTSLIKPSSGRKFYPRLLYPLPLLPRFLNTERP